MSAWVRSIIPSYALAPVKRQRRPGAPNKLEPHEQLELLMEFNALLKELRKFRDEDVGDLGPMKNESPQKFLKRMEHVVQHLHLTTPYSMESYERTDGKVEAEKKHSLEIFRSSLCLRKAALKESIAAEIAYQAIGKRRLSMNKLLYGLLAYYWYRSPKQQSVIRGIIERAENHFPEEHKRKVPRRVS